MELENLIDSIKSNKKIIKKRIVNSSIVNTRIENKKLPLLYYEMNKEANPHSLNLGYLWIEGKKIYNKRNGHYSSENIN